MTRLFGTKKHPKGPDFRHARLLEFDLSGTKFRVKAPPHSEPRHPPTIGPAISNIYDDTSYSTNFDKEDEPAVYCKGHIEYWPFYGFPLIQGRLGRMSFSFNVVKTTTKLNLFNPNQFERFVHLFIDTEFEPPKGGWPESKKQFRDFRVPVGWAVVEVNDITWITYQAHARHLPDQVIDWLTPITDQHAIFVSFKSYHNTPEMCCVETFQLLMDQISATFEVELSEQSRKEKAEAEQRWPDARYSEEVSEREWSKAS